ncbi:MAG: peptidoglycan-binding protein, partial [Devosiaceae bacterium]|nr:peptidoglycan-binding protein [Devosiaceae bacterium]
LFSGKVDGFYGPQTAEAIRAFEQKNALPVKGAMTVEIITSIINVSTTSRAPETVVPAPVASPLSPNINAISGRPASFNNGSQIPSASVILDDIIANIPQATVETSAPMPPVIAPIPPVGAAPAAVETAAVAPVSAPPLNPQIDAALIERIQFGLANLGFYNSSLDGIAGESTAKAIREFENFLSYPRTGNINEKVLLWLQEAGAFA